MGDVRWVLASHFTGPCPEVIIVGETGYVSPIREWHVPTLSDLPTFWSTFVISREFAVVLMDMNLSGSQAEVDALVEMCNCAERVIMEWATESEHPVITPSLLVNSRRLVAEVLLDIPQPKGSHKPSLRSLQVWR